MTRDLYHILRDDKENSRGLAAKVRNSLLRVGVAGASAYGISSFGYPSYAEAQSVCDSHKAVANNLKETYAETPTSMGVTVGGAVVEVYSSPEGSWTLVVTQPNGVTCLIAAGRNWEQLPISPKKKVKEYEM